MNCRILDDTPVGRFSLGCLSPKEERAVSFSPGVHAAFQMGKRKGTETENGGGRVI